MMRALWTAASGMTSQQTNVDVIANNLANINTTSYKKESAQFKSLLYQTIQSKTTSANGETKPVGAQVGLGVRNSSITTSYEQGTINLTNRSTDFAIDGKGFFAIRNLDGEMCFTRNGSFNWSLAPGGGIMLCNTEGYPVLDTNGEAIVLSKDYNSSKIIVDAYGNVCYPDDETGNPVSLDIQIALVQFSNPTGLHKEAGTMYSQTEASGEPMLEVENDDLPKSTIKQSALEASNVNVADEMVDLIVAQRAYEMNSKAIQAADEMMGQANQLKR